MRLSIIIQRLCDKTGTPQLAEAIIKHDLTKLPQGCMIWTGAHQKSQHVFKQQHMVITQPTAVVNYRGKRHAVPRLLYQLIAEPLHPFSGRRGCPNPLCVHPGHWGFSQHIPSDPPPPPEDWTPQEAQDLLDMYLAQNPGPLVNPEHDLLIDIPHQLLTEVLSRAEYSSWRLP